METGKTLREILEQDMNVFSGEEKTASVSTTSDPVIQEIDKLAAELGLLDAGDGAQTEAEKKAAEEAEAKKKEEGGGEPTPPKKEEDKKEEDKKEEGGEKKEASSEAEVMNSLFGQFWPEDNDLAKTATEKEHEKVAGEKVAAEEAFGACLHDYTMERFDNRIEKLAGMVLKSEGDSASEHTDPKFPQELKRDAEKEDLSSIKTTPNPDKKSQESESNSAAVGAFNGPKLAMAFRKLALQEEAKAKAEAK